MGLLDSITQIAGQALGGGAGGQNPLLEGILGMIAQQEGGLAGLVQNFRDKGLGEIAASWVGTGANLPISPEQIQNVLGSGALTDLAAKFGMSSEDVSGRLSQMLPEVVDKLTPGGQVEGSLDLGSALGALSGLFNK
ncbi:MAG: DUF937 domain-containing protein [Burkholderiales bacterium]|nr:DUF937 domain-containing protein [Burkholderiales bacterium]